VFLEFTIHAGSTEVTFRHNNTFREVAIAIRALSTRNRCDIADNVPYHWCFSVPSPVWPFRISDFGGKEAVQKFGISDRDLALNRHSGHGLGDGELFFVGRGAQGQNTPLFSSGINQPTAAGAGGDCGMGADGEFWTSWGEDIVVLSFRGEEVNYYRRKCSI
jgi:hypothetical protein